MIFLLLMAYAKKPPLNAHADFSHGARGLHFGMSFYLHPYFEYASIKAPVCLYICNVKRMKSQVQFKFT